ncbi:formyltransferase family protein [Helicobacter felis]|uniref:formyltransferase family protein n=1 Tax=Helicobacter felis TaxID=214 RepID=UPI000CEDF36A|nr:formyltransferase family protein [Helicobacter felis]
MFQVEWQKKLSALLEKSACLHLGVLFSGNGSNMQNLIEVFNGQSFWHPASQQHVVLKVKICVSSRPKAYGITRCAQLKMPCVVCQEEENLIQALRGCDLILLAGYMKILSARFVQSFPTINIHPSFLPYHKGKDAILKSFESQEGMGVSVHWVDAQVDHGPLILQETLQRLPEDSLEDFTQRVHALEQRLYPQALLQALGLEA